MREKLLRREAAAGCIDSAPNNGRARDHQLYRVSQFRVPGRVTRLPRPGTPRFLRAPGCGALWSYRADDQPARSQGARHGPHQDQEPGAAGQPAEARRLRARVHPDPEEAELGAAQGRARPADQRHRGHHLHPGRRPQPAGALARAHPRRPRQGPARASATTSSAARSTRWVCRAASRVARSTARSARSRNARSEKLPMPRRREVSRSAKFPSIRSTAARS